MEEKALKLVQNLCVKVDFLTQVQEEFYQKYFLKLSTASKSILTQEEAADYLGLKPSYLNQLTFHKKLKFIKKPGQKSKYFLKSDLDTYMLGESNTDSSDEELEDEILSSWSKGQKTKK